MFGEQMASGDTAERTEGESGRAGKSRGRKMRVDEVRCEAREPPVSRNRPGQQMILRSSIRVARRTQARLRTRRGIQVETVAIARRPLGKRTSHHLRPAPAAGYKQVRDSHCAL